MKKKYLKKNNFSSNEAIKFVGGSVGKGKQTKFYFRPCIRAEKIQYCAMKWSQIRRRIELCMREIVIRFEMNL
jgi:hypothetical protein